MKKHFLPAVMLLFCSCVLLQSCVKDSYQRTFRYTYYTPVYKTMSEVRADIKSHPPREIESPGKIFIMGQYIFLNERDRGIHVIDNANPSNPRNISFIDIPGNLDLAVKGNTLYADLFSDLVAIDISNPREIALKKIVEHVFPSRNYGGYFTADSTRIVTYWEKRDTTIVDKAHVDQWLKNGNVFLSYSAASMNMNLFSASVSPYGVGGSMARFAVLANRLYTVGTSDLQAFSLSAPSDPVSVSTTPINSTIETIYPFMDKLFIGSTTGMFIYNTDNPDLPVQVGQFSHVRSCDPVIADHDHAFVTLRSGTACGGSSNELDVLKLDDLTHPSLLKTYPFNNPHGLSMDRDLLFVCDGKDGLKIYLASDVKNLKLLSSLSGMETYDVIAFNGRALVVAADGLYQYDYSNPLHIRLLSKLGISN